TRIVGLQKNESDAILEMLYRHVETPEVCMRFHWQSDSVGFWDNRGVQHHALWDYYPHKRYGPRVTLCGRQPYWSAPSSGKCRRNRLLGRFTTIQDCSKDLSCHSVLG